MSSKGILKESGNSAIPRPSRLPKPATLAVRKRPAPSSDTTTDRGGKENAPSTVKRAKLDTTTTTVVPKTAAVVAPKKAVPLRASNKQVTSNKPSTTLKRNVAGGTRATTKGARADSKKPVAKEAKPKAVSSGSSQSNSSGSGGKQKRAAWDLKGRLQDMEALVATERSNSTSTIGDLQTQLAGFLHRLEDLEGIRQKQESTIQVKLQENTKASSQIKELEESLADTKQKLLESTRSYEHEIEMLRLSKDSLKRSHDELESNLSAARSEVTSLKAALAQMVADASGIQCQLDATKIARDQALTESSQKRLEITHLNQLVATHLQTIGDLKQKDRESEMVRRKLHNTIQELKGNIRVFCRVRPSLPGEAGYHRDSCDSVGSTGSNGSKGSKVNGQLHMDYPDESNDMRKLALQVSDQSSSLSSSALKNYDFEFDRVFGPSTSQQSVFEEISQLVQSALDGYNVCIFAYGQTGSGKTFTMEGPEEKSTSLPLEDQGATVMDNKRGMIPRAVSQVFDSARDLTEKGWEYTMEASFLEIYNETIRDLLSSNSTNSTTSHEIKRDPNTPGEVYVSNLTTVTVTSEAQVESLLERAAKNRAVAATLCNERSSRSHSVFRLRLVGRNEKTGENCRGTLNLIDLAGSERLTSSGSAGERLRETKNINKSLSNLGNVIMALANKDQHIPYRNSKLTYLLQTSLGGNSKTLMFVNVSPQPESFQETLCSLRFATKVNQCNIGSARKTVK